MGEVIVVKTQPEKIAAVGDFRHFRLRCALCIVKIQAADAVAALSPGMRVIFQKRAQPRTENLIICGTDLLLPLAAEFIGLICTPPFGLIALL